mgnify:CR=1 FL=1
MKRIETVYGPTKWLAAMLVVALTAACGGGGGQDGPPAEPAKTVAPTVSGTVNANGATNVPVNSKVGATFSEAMDPASITPATFFLMQGASAVPGLPCERAATARARARERDDGESRRQPRTEGHLAVRRVARPREGGGEVSRQ